MRDAAKAVARVAATITVSPLWLTYSVKRAFMGERAIEGSTEFLSLIPGLIGDYLRNAFLALTLDHCDRSATIQFGTIFSQTGTRIEGRAYIGPRCHIGLAHIGADVLLAAGVHVPSGGATHGIADPDVPIRDQPGTRTMVTIGEGTWVGSGAVVMADVGTHCVIGAGAVVTKPIPDRTIAGGVPARVIRSRDSA